MSFSPSPSTTFFIQDVLTVHPVLKTEKKMNILIQNGKIHLEASAPTQKSSDLKIISGSSLIAFPGFIDVGTRIGEPGFEIKETIKSVSNAALSAGYSTLIHSSFANPVFDSPYLIHYMKDKTTQLGKCEFFSLASFTRNSQGEELSELGLLSESGAVGFYDDDKTIMNSYLFKKGCEYLKKFDRPLIHYCEDFYLSHKTALHEGVYSNLLGLRGSPAAAEEIIVARDIALCRLTQAPIHFIKISSQNSLQLIKNAKKEGLPITASISIAHLYLSEENLVSYETNLKTNPPLRTTQDQRAIEEAVMDGTIDFIISDHHPHGVLDKMTEFDLAEPGMSTLDYTPSLIIEWALQKKLSLLKISELLFLNPARILLKNKFNFQDPFQNLTLFSPQESWQLTKENMHSKSKNTFFMNRKLQGRTMMTFIKGQLQYEKK